MANWRLYYGDGSTFSSDEGTPEEAPATNLAVIAQKDATTGRALVARRDFYAYHDGEWYGHDLVGLIDYLTRAGIVKLGRTLPNDVYENTMLRAAQDPDMPAKSARRRGEPFEP